MRWGVAILVLLSACESFSFHVRLVNGTGASITVTTHSRTETFQDVIEAGAARDFQGLYFNGRAELASSGRRWSYPSVAFPRDWQLPDVKEPTLVALVTSDGRLFLVKPESGTPPRIQPPGFPVSPIFAVPR